MTEDPDGSRGNCLNGGIESVGGFHSLATGGGDLNLNGDVWQKVGDSWQKWTIFASFLNGWDKLAAAPTAAEAAVVPVTAPYGVCRQDSRKGWLFHTPSEYDPHGTILIFR